MHVVAGDRAVAWNATADDGGPGEAVQEQPKKYEDLGRVVVGVSGEINWDERGHSPAGFARLKSAAAAAAKGANGVLLASDRVENDFVALVGDGSRFYHVPVQRDPRAAVAHATYVIED